MAARPAQSEKSGEDNKLIIYRLDRVEAAVKEVGDKLDRQDNIKKSDLTEFRDAVLSRINEVRDGLQNQIDDKADKAQVDDLRNLVKAVGTAITSVIVGLTIYFITRT